MVLKIIDATEMRSGTNVIVDGVPCTVKNIDISKTGKHGHAKASFIGKDVFTGKKHEGSGPTDHVIAQPVLTQEEYPLTYITDDDFTHLMMPDNDTRENLALPDSELGESIATSFDELGDDDEMFVTVLSWGDFEEAIIAFKIKKI